MTSMITYIIVAILLFGSYGAGSLAFQEFTQGNICPKILGIPACYIILACFIVPLIVHLFKFNNLLYFLATGLAWSIATYGSIMQIRGIIECPKTSGGTPMCFISFGIFTTLILLKSIEIAKSNTGL